MVADVVCCCMRRPMQSGRPRSTASSPSRSPLGPPPRDLPLATVSPYRFVDRPASPARTRSPVASRSARLSLLLQEFDQKGLRPWGARVEDINMRFVRLNYVSDEEVSFLKQAQRRNVAFMSSVENLLRDAVAAGAGVDGALARRAQELWDAARGLNERIVVIVSHANKSTATPVITGRGRPTSRSSSTQRSPSAGRRASPARPVPAAPTAMSEVQRPPPRRSSPTRVTANEVSNNDRRQMLEGLVSLERRVQLTPQDFDWARSIFVRLYGTEGAVRFEQWCGSIGRQRR